MYKKTKLFKKYDYPSWSMNKEGEVFRKKYTASTWWPIYIKQAQDCSMEGTGYVLKAYARGDGIKGALVGAKAPFCRTMEQRKNKSWPVITAKVYFNRTEKARKQEGKQMAKSKKIIVNKKTLKIMQKLNDYNSLKRLILKKSKK